MLVHLVGSCIVAVMLSRFGTFVASVVISSACFAAEPTTPDEIAKVALAPLLDPAKVKNPQE